MRISRLKLKVEMAKRDMVQAELAKISNISRQTINGILAGRRCSLETGQKIADALKIDLKDILQEV